MHFAKIWERLRLWAACAFPFLRAVSLRRRLYQGVNVAEGSDIVSHYLTLSSLGCASKPRVVTVNVTGNVTVPDPRT